jgi:truncated hemoglobin YjbI
LPVLRLTSLPSAVRAGLAPPASQSPRIAREPRWAWDTTFLGCLTAMLRKELVGATPDGLRINWHVTEGSFVGPGLDAVVLPGAADWMRIRRDGVAVVSVQACFETNDGARVFGSYGGLFDLGPDGYARALRDEYDPLPPVVVTPTYATADPRLEWLNRAQCVGVGRVDMAALRVEFDVYVVRVKGPEREAGSLYTRLGGYDVIAAFADDFIAWVVADRQLGRLFVSGYGEERLKAIRQLVVNQLCELTGGSCVYTGRDMKTVHKGMGITGGDWRIAVDLFNTALTKHGVAPRERTEFLSIIEEMKGAIVEYPER